MKDCTSQSFFNELFSTVEDKAKAFDQIAKEYYYCNFGKMQKADFDVLMFSIYINQIIEKNQEADQTIDYKTISDYKLSQLLGITQQKIRNLKIKKQLVYPVDYTWEKTLAKLMHNARYDADSKKIFINIPDPNLYYEIENFIEEQGAYVEKTFNKKILTLRVEYYIALMIETEDSSTKKDAKKNLIKHIKQTEKENISLDENNIGYTLKGCLKTSSDVISIINNLTSILNPENALLKALLNLLNISQNLAE